MKKEKKVKCIKAGKFTRCARCDHRIPHTPVPDDHNVKCVQWQFCEGAKVRCVNLKKESEKARGTASA